MCVFAALYLSAFHLSASTKKYILVYKSGSILFCITALAIFLGLRAYVFTDYKAYKIIFDDVPTLFDGIGDIYRYLSRDVFSSLETGYILFNILCKTISPSYFFLQFALSFIDLLILYKFFKRYIPDTIILGFLFFFVFGGISLEINLMRNVKAIMLFILSIKYLEKRNALSYFGINFIGMLFHSSSVVYFPLFFILNRRFSRKTIICLFVTGCVIFLFSIEWIKELIVPLADAGDSRLSILVRMYMNSDLYSKPAKISIGFIERILTFFIFILFYKKLAKANKVNIIFLNCSFIYNFIYLYCSEFYALVFRFPFLFIFSYWVLYPQIYSILSRRNKILFLTVFLFYGVLKVLVTYNSLGMSYQSVLFHHNSYEQAVRISERESNAWKNQMLNKMQQ